MGTGSRLPVCIMPDLWNVHINMLVLSQHKIPRFLSNVSASQPANGKTVGPDAPRCDMELSLPAYWLNMCQASTSAMLTDSQAQKNTGI